MKKNPKYLIIDGEIVMEEVNRHRDLIDFKDSKTGGGGWYHIDEENQKLYFYGCSTEFGGVTYEDFMKAFENSHIHPKFEKMKIYHSFMPMVDGKLPKDSKLVREEICVVFDDGTYMWTIPSEYGTIKVRVQRGQPLEPGEVCMFYNSISKILSIQNPDAPLERQVADVESRTRVRKEDAKSVGKEAGSWGTMKHGFSVKQLAKVFGCTHEALGVPLINDKGEYI